MVKQPNTVMAFAAHHNRFGFVFMIGQQPMDWQLVYQAAATPELAKRKIAGWLHFYKPDLIVTEDLAGSQRKGRKAQQLILAIKEVAFATDADNAEVARSQPFANKYEQIERLCEEFPQMKAVAPARRRIYDAEPPYVTLFEALALAKQASR
ncbi:hypothetical protein [uncultured Litoreibacter sp.]|uniref:hypothetical protein n=1 Tax=uncultured Litoreibacter sp. TaxID=1392394 RepID=UPI00260EA61C|nr:hypothetical protein [uncultured Litoreibacter sp.]